MLRPTASAERFVGALLLTLTAVVGCEDDAHLGAAFGDGRVEPSALDFGRVRLGRTVSRSVEVSTPGDDATASWRRQGDEDFALSWASTTGPTATARVEFTPQSVGRRAAVYRREGLELALEAEGVSVAVDLDGAGARCRGLGGSRDLGAVPVGRAKTALVPLSIDASSPVRVVSVEPRTEGPFSVTLADDGRALSVRYLPLEGGTDEQTFALVTDLDDEATDVVFCGRGATASLCSELDALRFADTATDLERAGEVQVISCGTEPFVFGPASTSVSEPFAATRRGADVLLPGASATFAVRFRPRAPGEHEGALRVEAAGPLAASFELPLLGTGTEPCRLRILPDPIFVLNRGSDALVSWAPIALVNTGTVACTIRSGSVTTAATGATVRWVDEVPLTIAPGTAANSALLEGGAGWPGIDVEGRFVLETTDDHVVDSAVRHFYAHRPHRRYLDVSPGFAVFGPVRAGETATRRLRLAADGFGAVKITALELVGGGPNLELEAPAQDRLEEGEAIELVVRYRPRAPESLRARLTVHSDDLVDPVKVVEIVGEARQPRVCSSTTAIAFGEVRATSVRTLDVWACGDAPVSLLGVEDVEPNPDFARAAAPAWPRVLAPGERLTLEVAYTPRDALSDHAAFAVRTDDPTWPAIRVDLDGRPGDVPEAAGAAVSTMRVVPDPAFPEVTVLEAAIASGGAAAPRFEGGGCVGCHAYSPDGRYAAVVDASGLRLVDLTTNATRATGLDDFRVWNVSWEPAGASGQHRYVFYGASTANPGELDLGLASVEDGYLGPVPGASEVGVAEGWPSWGPDGRIVFERAVGPAASTGYRIWGSDLYAVDALGGTPAPLIPGAPAVRMHPAHDPSGRWVAFVRADGSFDSGRSTRASTLRLAAADGSGAVLELPAVNAAGGGALYPTWNLAGTLLAFSSNRDARRPLWSPEVPVRDWDLFLVAIDPSTGAAPGDATRWDGLRSEAMELGLHWRPRTPR